MSTGSTATDSLGCTFGVASVLFNFHTCMSVICCDKTLTDRHKTCMLLPFTANTLPDSLQRCCR